MSSQQQQSESKKRKHDGNEDLMIDEGIFNSVQKVYESVLDERREEQLELWKEHLETDVCQVLLKAAPSTSSSFQQQQQQQQQSQKKSNPITFPRLLTNNDEDPPALQLFCQPCSITNNNTGKDNSDDVAMKDNIGQEMASANSSTATNHTSTDDDDYVEEIIPTSTFPPLPDPSNNNKCFRYKLRLHNNKWLDKQIGPPLSLEGAANPLPSSSSTIFLKTHYATEDEKNLKYVPYFGEDDEEDVVSDLYNLTEREKQMELGSEYQERETNAILDQVLTQLLLQRGATRTVAKLAMQNKHDNKVTQIHLSLAEIMDESISRIQQRYELLLQAKSSDATTTPTTAATASTTTTTTTTTTPTPTISKANPTSYSQVMDSYRPLFCRRCFTYDCNMHSNLQKPNLELQGELAVQKERDGFWNHPTSNGDGEEASNSKMAKQKDDAMLTDKPSTGTSPKKKAERHNKSPRKQSSKQEQLTPVQKAICERMFLIFQGDVTKMAATMGASFNLVQAYCIEQDYQLQPFQKLDDDHIQMFIKQNRVKGRFVLNQSMNQYNPTWLKNVENAEIHPLFVPCDHSGLCNEEVCSCVRNAIFCTKHCAWGIRSRNFFRGCNCAGKCTTKSCSCFAAKRECDPDVCKSCGACSDPPNQPATKQRCRNDSIGMRRHTQVLLGKSKIADAGWGLYNRFALKKGDFVHEYVGEVISQEEAERRGRVYDKVNRSYLFNLSSDYVVDASRKGNKTRFANHSSKPNCYTKMVNVNGDIRIGLFAREDISPQTELFFDYRYDVSMNNDLIVKPGMTVDWMKDSKMANKINKLSCKNIVKKHA